MSERTHKGHWVEYWSGWYKITGSVDVLSQQKDIPSVSEDMDKDEDPKNEEWWPYTIYPYIYMYTQYAVCLYVSVYYCSSLCDLWVNVFKTVITLVTNAIFF